MADIKEARVLVDHGDHKINDILKGEAAALAHAQGLADGHPTAVAYAKKLAKAAKVAAGDDSDAEAEAPAE